VKRTITVQVGWLWILLGLVLIAAALAWALRPEPRIDPARIRLACAEYAAWDLAGLASICRDAGYQQENP
jgi:hypothetical protein